MLRTQPPGASQVISGVPIYDGDFVRRAVDHPRRGSDLMDEWAECLATGAGVFAVAGAFRNLDAVDTMTEVFKLIIDREKQAVATVADHFAKAGANSRAWNVLQKAALLDPQAYFRYYSNPVISLASESWLGPWYQLSAQVNIVHPGGQSQTPHRDYHLGFQSDSDVARFPLRSHILSQSLTLQGPVAHSEIPIESGPTRLLPFSQLYETGYLAWRDQTFIDYFDDHAIQLALHKGDAVFFNPGLHHAARANRTADLDRMANLLQISSAMGRPMESIDTYAIAAAVYGPLQQMISDGVLSDAEARTAIAASADGYSFPSNLDTDAPLNGMSAESAQQLMARALGSEWGQRAFLAALDAHRKRRSA